MKTKLQSWLFSSSRKETWLEGVIGIGLAMLLVDAVVAELPVGNVAPTLFLILQFPLLWAGLRQRLAEKLTGAVFLREVGGGLLLGAAAMGFTLLFSHVFKVRDFLDRALPLSHLTLLLLGGGLLGWLLYRMVFYGGRTWWHFSQKSFLWTLVNSYLGVVGIVALLTIGVYLAFEPSKSATMYVPENWLASLILNIARHFLPMIGVSLIYMIAVLLVLLPLVLLISYPIARNFVKRIQNLAQAMHKAQEGDLNVRVTPGGQDEVAQLQRDFNRMAADLQTEHEKVAQLLANQRELATVISHELRTPLTVMRATLELNLEDPSEDQSDLQVLYQETLHLQSLVDDLFTLSLLDAQKLALTCTWTDPRPILENCLKALQPVAMQKKLITISSEFPPGLPLIWADAERLTQVIRNLLQNAIRHTQEGGVILLKAADSGAGTLEIEVLDSGEGISAEDLPRIWERYYRGRDHGGQRVGRTGIGLSLVKELVEAMDGTVGVESTPGQGSRFGLHLRSRSADPQ